MNGFAKTFQARVNDWMHACFGPKVSRDKVERRHRFLEEAIELDQAGGGSREEAHQLVDYVHDRPVGDPFQEVGGVQVTLAAFCEAHGIFLADAAEAELARVWGKIEQIRAKQAAKPQFGPLPGLSTPAGFDPRIHVPGLWRCPKCAFTLIQSNLNAVDGTVTARDQPGDPCPNCDGPLWRTSWKEHAAELAERLEEAIADRNRLQQLINTPIVDDFFEGVRNEMAHQVERWGSEKDAGKEPTDWLFLVGHLASKAAMALATGNASKGKHHVITAAAALGNWFKAVTGVDLRMRPGIEDPK